MGRLWCNLLLSASLSGFAVCAEAAIATDLPAPDQPARHLQLPDSFHASVFAHSEEIGGARMMAFGPDGNLYVTDSRAGKVLMLPDRDHDGKADEIVPVADGLNAPNGLVFIDGQLLVGNQDGIVRLERKNGAGPATGITPVIPDLPSGGHTLKTVKLGPDGYLYLNVGSSCNVCVESDPTRATIQRYTVEGRPAGALATLGRHKPNAVWATGLRNAQGLAWHPETGALYATNDGADMRADVKGGPPNDELPPEHFNLIEAGKNYGWPYCWGDRHPDPNFPAEPGYCERTQPPAVTFPSHSTPIGMTFLDRAAAFPAEYRDDAIVALHGSWNRAQPSGYKLVRVKFKDGKPVEVTDFATGWLSARGAWGRPVDVIVGPDGVLFVSDDRAGIIYRITYGKD